MPPCRLTQSENCLGSHLVCSQQGDAERLDCVESVDSRLAVNNPKRRHDTITDEDYKSYVLGIGEVAGRDGKGTARHEQPLTEGR